MTNLARAFRRSADQAENIASPTVAHDCSIGRFLERAQRWKLSQVLAIKPQVVLHRSASRADMHEAVIRACRWATRHRTSLQEHTVSVNASKFVDEK